MRRRMISVAASLFMAVVLVNLSGCVTTKTIDKQFAKKGYTVGSYSWNDMSGVCPFINSFPAFGQTSLAYIVANDVYTFVYKCTTADVESYASVLKTNGFSEIASGVYAKRSADNTYYYKVKVTSSLINKESYYFLGYSVAAMN